MMAVSTTDNEAFITTEAVYIPIDMTFPYLILIAVNIGIIAPFSLWLTKRYHSTSNEYPYNARRPKLVIFYNLFALFYMAIYIPLHLVGFELAWKNNNTVEEWWEIATYLSIQTPLYLSQALRIWHSFYDFQLAYQVSDRQWKSILNEEIREKDQSFVFKHKDSLGV